MSKSLYYKGEFRQKITNEEANEIMDFRGIQLNFKGEFLKKSLMEIFNEKEEAGIDYEKLNYIKSLEKEQEALKIQTPEEKTFRNYKQIFCWKYLLQVGFTNFFETKDWKKESPHDTFIRFDKKIWKDQPNRIRKFTEETEQFFRDNLEEIWVSKEILNKFLPKGYQSLEVLKENIKVIEKEKV